MPESIMSEVRNTSENTHVMVQFVSHQLVKLFDAFKIDLCSCNACIQCNSGIETQLSHQDVAHESAGNQTNECIVTRMRENGNYYTTDTGNHEKSPQNYDSSITKRISSASQVPVISSPSRFQNDGIARHRDYAPVPAKVPRIADQLNKHTVSPVSKAATTTYPAVSTSASISNFRPHEKCPPQFIEKLRNNLECTDYSNSTVGTCDNSSSAEDLSRYDSILQQCSSSETLLDSNMVVSADFFATLQKQIQSNQIVTGAVGQNSVTPEHDVPLNHSVSVGRVKIEPQAQAEDGSAAIAGGNVLGHSFSSMPSDGINDNVSTAYSAASTLTAGQLSSNFPNAIVSSSGEVLTEGGAGIPSGTGIGGVQSFEDWQSSILAGCLPSSSASTLEFQRDHYDNKIPSMMVKPQPIWPDTLAAPPNDHQLYVEHMKQHLAIGQQTTLWKFLSTLLDHDIYLPLIQWTDRHMKEFKLLNSASVAYLWGVVKNRPTMNYEKMSRILRYYYKKKIVEKVKNKSYTYRFVVTPDDAGFDPTIDDTAGLQEADDSFVASDLGPITHSVPSNISNIPVTYGPAMSIDHASAMDTSTSISSLIGSLFPQTKPAESSTSATQPSALSSALALMTAAHGPSGVTNCEQTNQHHS